MNAILSPIDYFVIAVYLAGTLAIGLAVGRRQKSGQDYFLAGRQLRWWMIGMSLVATDIGGTDIVGVGGAAYRYGLAVGNFEWIGCVPAMIVGAFVFIPFFWRSGIYTILEYMERRYNASVRTALALCWLVFMACNIGLMLYASATMMESLFGWHPTVCILLTAALVGVYTISGGLTAVVYTDTIQCAVMIGGCLLVLVMGLIDVGGVSELRDAVNVAMAEQAGADVDTAVDHTALILPVDTTSPFPWSGVLVGLAFILSPGYWIGNQAIVQRSLGARSEFEAKAAYVWGAVLKNLIPLIIAVPGMIALAKNLPLENADAAFPQLAATLLPTGLRGVFVAAFVAALMSSIDSYLNSAATIFTNDLYKRFARKGASDGELLRVGRVVTLVLVIWAITFAHWMLEHPSGLYSVFQTLMAFFQGPGLAILLAGVLWRRATGIGAFVGFVGGVATSVALYTLNQESVYTSLGLQPLFQIADPFLYLSVWAFLVTWVLLILVSLLTPPEPEEKLKHMIVRRSNRSTP